LILAHVEGKVIQDNIPSFHFVTSMGHKCLFNHINVESYESYIDKKNLHIILEGGGSGYASGDIAQVIVKNLFKTLFLHLVDGF